MSQFYFNGNILTGDPKKPLASAMTVENGVITAIGDSKDFNISGSEKVDLKNQTVLPGFHDAHIHLWKVGQLDLFILDLRGVESIDSLKGRIKKAANETKVGCWIVGRGFNESVLNDNRMPTASDLDSVTLEHPVYLIRTCAHIAVVNSLALKTCGIDESTSAPEGGRIGMSDGRVNGQLFETALGLVTRHIPRTTREEYQQMIRTGASKMLKAGITSVTDPAVHPELMEAYRQTAGEMLGLRLDLMPMTMPDGGQKTYPLPELHSDPWMRITTAKLFSDGGLSGATAALNRTYKNQSDKGILRFSTKEITEHIANARSAGYRLGIHAIGDRAISQVLDAYETTNKQFGRTRNRIEHFGLPTNQDLQRAAEQGVVAVPQTIFLEELGENFLNVLDDTYLERCYPIKTLMKYNIPFAMSSDAPVVKEFNPWKNIAVALTRKTKKGNVISPSENIMLEQALSAYTHGSAYAEGTEHLKGSLSIGKYADFIVIDRDPYKISISEISNIKNLSTYTGGVCVYHH